jgi:uncharacterized repeat protein (TIGR03803 family)
MNPSFWVKGGYVQNKRSLILFAVFFGFLTITAPLFAAATENVLYSFCTASNCTNGLDPNAGLIFDAAGNLYGTTAEGGAYGEGTVFQLVLAGGTWSETVLYSFCKLSKCTDGEYPTAGLIFDSAGNLYGTTSEGGAYGNGTVFQLVLVGGTWNETVLYNFCPATNCPDGAGPKAGLIFDGGGNLYGTTYGGGAAGCSCGTVFQLKRTNGHWREHVLHSFKGKDGYHPSAGLIFDAAGNLYSTTFGGGATGYGTIFQLTSASGRWNEKVLHNFTSNGKDGFLPKADLIFDSAGNLYGTTNGGGAHGYGTVFQLTQTGGTWKERPLHSFDENGTDGYYPYAGLILDSGGALYGTTFRGGVKGYGTVFQLKMTNGRWREKLLWSFNNNGTDGIYPYADLTSDAAGNLYGTTSEGGGYQGGTVFQLTP